MSKSLLTFSTALGIAVLSLALIVGRWYTLGAEIDGAPGTSAWIVHLQIDGELLTTNGSIKTALPPDFRRQHIVSERFESKELETKYATPEMAERER